VKTFRQEVARANVEKKARKDRENDAECCLAYGEEKRGESAQGRRCSVDE